MPRTFFDQVLVTEAPRRGSGWMKAASLVMHVAIVLVVVVLPITAAFDLPGVYTSLPPVMLATVSKIPPPPATPPEVVTPVTVLAPSVPLEAPAGINPEKERPLPTAPSVPGGLPGVGAGANALAMIGNSTLSIERLQEPLQEPRYVGGDIKPPQRVSDKVPYYPPAAQAARIEGTVILEAIIDAAGVVQNVRVLRSVPLLDRAAIEAVQQWRYTPTRLNGVAIPVIMSVTVTFTLR